MPRSLNVGSLSFSYEFSDDGYNSSSRGFFAPRLLLKADRFLLILLTRMLMCGAFWRRRRFSHFDSVASQIIRGGNFGHGSLRMFIPAWIVVTGYSFANFKHGEQSAHIDHIEWAGRSNHRKAVARHLHFHLRHFAHAVRAHRHVTRQ